MDRAFNEHRAGRPLADVVVTIAGPILVMEREGVFAKYDSPGGGRLFEGLIDPNEVSIHRYRTPTKFQFLGTDELDTEAYAEKKKESRRIFLR
jgi:hypothetical protein